MSDNKHTCQVFHFDLYGTREEKYEFLNSHSLSDVEWEELKPEEPHLFFAPKDFSLQEEYERGFKVDALMKVKGTGVSTLKDAVAYSYNKENLKHVLDDFAALSESEIAQKYKVDDKSRDWKISWAKQHVISTKADFKHIHPVLFRPFDIRYTYFTNKSKGFVSYPSYEVEHNMLFDNVALVVPRQTTQEWRHVSVSNTLVDSNYTSSARLLGAGLVFPLYLYKENLGVEERIVNFNIELYEKIAKGLNYLPCTDDNVLIDPTSEYAGVLYPQDLFDYIYAVLHSPSYRERYKEFLKIDFPRIPYPTDWEQFRDFAEKGEELRMLHLMENLPSRTGVTFPVAGSMQVDCYRWQDGRVYVNAEQYFEGVPESAWFFYIGGYQPAQKWLKDRKGMTLSFEDVKHYGNIIYVLRQTERIMQEIDKIIKID